MDMVQRSMGMLLNNTPWHMPITEKPLLDTTEIWELINLTEDSHPIHLHLVRFQILDRRPFDTFEYMQKQVVRYTGPVVPPVARGDGMEGYGTHRSRHGDAHHRPISRVCGTLCVALSHPGT